VCACYSQYTGRMLCYGRGRDDVVDTLTHKKRVFVIYRGHTTLSLMWRLFCWGGRPSQEPEANPSTPADINAFPGNRRRTKKKPLQLV
jgi:hypothetical protein